jgi:hypothetical protein
MPDCGWSVRTLRLSDRLKNSLERLREDEAGYACTGERWGKAMGEYCGPAPIMRM